MFDMDVSSHQTANTSSAPSALPTNPSSQVVYLNGSLVARANAKVDIEDRGFMFADGVYEVIRYYNGKPLAMDEHVKRLTRSLEAVRINAPDMLANIHQATDQLVQANGLSHASVYWQITRGSAPRNHTIPSNIRPTCMAIAYKAHDLRQETSPRCVSASIEPDMRWSRCDIKSLMLLANVLTKDTANQQGCYEAILHRDNIITEGCSTSVLAVMDGVIHTHPANQWILDSITRRIILKLADELGIKVVQTPLTINQLAAADEIMLAGTTTHLAAVTHLNGQPMGHGKAGLVTSKLFSALREYIFRQCPMP